MAVTYMESDKHSPETAHDRFFRRYLPKKMPQTLIFPVLVEPGFQVARMRPAIETGKACLAGLPIPQGRQPDGEVFFCV